MSRELDDLLAEQVGYYRARAPEYDEIYGGGAFHELPDSLLDEFPVGGDVLELACGTGRWTPALARRGRFVTAVDAAPEMLAVAQERVTGLPVELVAADIFDWRPPRRYDTVFFAFWLSHVPPGRFGAFWSLVDAALGPGGRACFLDTSDEVRQFEEAPPEGPGSAVRRHLADGTAHRLVKVFHDPGTLAAQLAELGWSARVRRLGALFLIGTAAR